MKLLEIAKKRKATKQYNPDLKISKENLEYIFNVINTAPTSIGLQHWRVIDIKDSKLRESIKPYFLESNKLRLEQASDILFFITKSKEWFLSKNHKEEIVKIIKEKQNAISNEYKTPIDPAGVENELKYIQNYDHGFNGHNITEWSKRQAYIALGFGMLAAMELNINSTPIEGFTKDLEKSLKEKKLILNDESLAVVLMLGYVKNVEHPTHGNKQLRKDIKDNFIIK